MADKNTEPPQSSVTTPQNGDKSGPTPSSPRKTPSGRRTPTTIKKLDVFFSHLHRALQTRDGLDSMLLFLAYSTQLAATILETPNPAVFRNLSHKLVSLTPEAVSSRVSWLLPASRLRWVLSAVLGARLRLASRLRALLEMLDDWHTMSRLWGLLSMWMLAKELITASVHSEEPGKEGKDKKVQRVETTIAATQIISLISFFALENTAWLSKRKVFTWSDKAQSRLILWCVRSWGVYVFAELGRLLFERAQKKSDTTSEDGTDSKSEWNKKFVQAIAWAPLAIHWTRPDGLLPESVAAALAAYAELISVQGLWKGTAVVA